MTLSERFWSKVLRDADTDCWVWKASRHKKTGYGKFSRGPKHAGWVEAHRMAYVLVFGQIPDGLQVLHRCDNRICCNPAHLFLGTAVDNINDKVSKGRHRWKTHYGSAVGTAVLTEAQVRDIRQDFQSGVTRSVLARAHSVSWTQINKIVSGQYWRHILTPIERAVLEGA